MDSLIHDLRYAGRTLLRARGFAAAAIITLGLGIGATTMIFSMVNAILLRPFPFDEPDRLMLVAEDDIVRNHSMVNPSWPTFLDWRVQATSFASMGAFDERTVNVRIAEDAERMRSTFATHDLFTTLRTAPVAGRIFSADEDAPGAAPVVLISHTLWQERFAGAANVVGRTMFIDGTAHTIVGIMPAGFEFPEAARLWLPLGPHADTNRGAHMLRVVGRLAEGVSIEQANTQLAAIGERLAAEYRASADYRARSMPLHDAIVEEVRPIVLLLLGAVGFVLLIACANVANLLLARAAGREREIAIRGALGASGARIVRQMLTESAVIALAGGGLGVLLSMWWLDVVLDQIPEALPYWMEPGVDARVLVFTTAVALGTSVIFGLAPALQARRADQQTALREGGRGLTPGSARARLRGVFVVSQLAASIVLLVAGLLMVRSFLAMKRVDPGFDTTGIVTMNLSLPQQAYPAAVNTNAFYDQLLARLRAQPYIRMAELVNNFPISGSNVSSNFSIEGVGEVQDAHAHNQAASPGYFEAMGIPVLRGRAFTDADALGAERVAIINEALAERYFPGQDPLGRGIMFGATDEDDEPEWYRIVGVVANVNQRDVNQAQAEPSLYRPFAQSPWHSAALVVRVRGDLASAIASIRRESRALDADVPVDDVRTVEAVLDDAVWDSRLFTSLFAAFAAGALALAAIGLYGVVAYGVTQRTHEIGVRVALGATTRDVLRLVVGQGMTLTAVGLGVGIVLAFAVSRVMEGMLFGVTAGDPVTFALVPPLLALVALLATWLPARRAARVPAMVALRAD